MTKEEYYAPIRRRTRVVSPKDVPQILRSAGWDEKTIRILGDGGFPEEIEVGDQRLLLRNAELMAA